MYSASTMGPRPFALPSATRTSRCISRPVNVPTPRQILQLIHWPTAAHFQAHNSSGNSYLGKATCFQLQSHFHEKATGNEKAPVRSS